MDLPVTLQEFGVDLLQEGVGELSMKLVMVKAGDAT